MWGVIFSFLEGRRVTDLLASLFGLSIAVSSGTAKSIGLFVVNTLNVSEFWMPALIGAVALPLLAALGYLLDRLPRPTAEDKALRVERVTLDKQQRWNLFRSLCPRADDAFLCQSFPDSASGCKGRFSGEDCRCECRRFLLMDICQGGRSGHADYSGGLCFAGTDKESYESIVHPVGAGHCRGVYS